MIHFLVGHAVDSWREQHRSEILAGWSRRYGDAPAFLKKDAVLRPTSFRSPTLAGSASDWLASVSPACTFRYLLYLAVSSRSAAAGVV